jgi:eukaryotic-like serine/threonine-protein kinase
MKNIGSKIGNIRIAGVLGEGGMGKVYAGFDERLRREVALKALRADQLDETTRARLLREARSLSQLDHPHICAIHDLLEREEGDFLVLERIRGKNLRELLADGIEPGLKLRIADQIAQALAAAHAKGIVHRDLKLPNVMLTEEGAVKVLDFGLALPSGETPVAEGDGMDGPAAQEWTALLRTQIGSVVGTAACMSPEQARGETVTTASDIYSFGLLLQELFTGFPPYPRDLPVHLLLTRAQVGDTLGLTGIDRDMAALIERMKALAPAQRPTAVEILRRLAWIRDRPRRWARNAAALLAVSLLAAGGVKYASDLRRERDRAVAAQAAAERARTEAEEVAGFLEEVFEGADPRSGKGGEVLARELLERGAARVRKELQDQPLVRARLMGSIGRIYRQLGLLKQAEPLLEEALAVRERGLGPAHLEVAASLLDLGQLRLEESRGDAEPLFRRALAIREKILGPDDPQVAAVLQGLGSLLGRLSGKWKDAEAILRRALAIYQRHPPGADLARVLHELAVTRLRQGDLKETERLLRQSLALREKIFPPDHPDVATSIVALGVLLATGLRHGEAIPLYRRGLASLEKSLGPEHPTVALTWNNLGISCMAVGRNAEAEASLRHALAIQERVFGRDHVEILPSLYALARLYRQEQRWADVDAVVARSLPISDGNLPAGNDYSKDLRELRKRP